MTLMLSFVLLRLCFCTIHIFDNMWHNPTGAYLEDLFRADPWAILHDSGFLILA